MSLFTIRELSLRLQRELFSYHSTSVINNEMQGLQRNLQRAGFRSLRKNKDVTPQYSGIQQTSLDPGSEPLKISRLFKPFLFTIGFSSASMAGASIWQYENMRRSYLESKKWDWVFARHAEKKGKFRQELNKWWNKRSEGEKMFIPICALNCLVFAAWRINKFQPAMAKYFLSSPSQKNLCWPMFLSTFSHFSVIHLAANMFVLHSFSNVLVHMLGKEQFLGLYVSAGVISSFTSYLFKVLSQKSGFSLGASGAIMALVSFVCFTNPDEQLYLIFLPFFTFNAGLAIKAILAFDTAGLLFSWKFFDHAAHLGGALTGVAWQKWGNQHIWQKREPFLELWHEIRGSVKK